jgi:hypothetical protein
MSEPDLDAAVAELANALAAANLSIESGDGIGGIEQALEALLSFIHDAGMVDEARPIILLLMETGDLRKGRSPRFLRSPNTGGTSAHGVTDLIRRNCAVAAVELLHDIDGTLREAYKAVAPLFGATPQQIKKWRERLDKDGRECVEAFKAPYSHYEPNRAVVLEVTAEWARNTARP